MVLYELVCISRSANLAAKSIVGSAAQESQVSQIMAVYHIGNPVSIATNSNCGKHLGLFIASYKNNGDPTS
jgi:hypothetical protein